MDPSLLFGSFIWIPIAATQASVSLVYTVIEFHLDDPPSIGDPYFLASNLVLSRIFISPYTPAPYDFCIFLSTMPSAPAVDSSSLNVTGPIVLACKLATAKSQ